MNTYRGYEYARINDGTWIVKLHGFTIIEGLKSDEAAMDAIDTHRRKARAKA